MPFLIGDVICMRTTGERMCVLGAIEQDVIVRRPVILESGAISHSKDTFAFVEVETLKEHGARQIAEMLMKAEAQKQLIQAENKLQAQIEQEETDEVLLKPTLVKKEPVLN